MLSFTLFIHPRAHTLVRAHPPSVKISFYIPHYLSSSCKGPPPTLELFPAKGPWALAWSLTVRKPSALHFVHPLKIDMHDRFLPSLSSQQSVKPYFTRQLWGLHIVCKLHGACYYYLPTPLEWVQVPSGQKATDEATVLAFYMLITSWMLITSHPAEVDTNLFRCATH